MSATLWWLILGLLIGWLIEWMIDWVYWRRPRETAAPVAELSAAPQQQPAREGPVLQQARAEVTRLEAELEQAQKRAQTMAAELESMRGQTSDLARAQADLQAANEAALEHEAQIDQLRAQLAGNGSAQLRAELDAANELAAERQDEIDRLRAQLADAAEIAASPALDDAATQPRVVLSEPEQEAARDMNFATVMLSAEDLAGHMPPTGDGQQTGVEEVAAPLLEQQVAAPALRDPLIDINGIGPVYEQKLFNAGVYTFAALADLSPEQVRAIVQPEKWQHIEPEQWIAEARRRAGLNE